MKTLLSTISFVAFCCGYSFAQTVTTISSPAISIDDALTIDSTGTIYGSHFNGTAVYRITPDGEESLFIDGFTNPNGHAFDSQGNLFLNIYSEDRVVKIAPDLTVEEVLTGVNGPSGMIKALGSDTMIVTIAEESRLVKIAPDGEVIDWVTNSNLVGPVGLCYDDEENLYVANFSDRRIFRVNPDGSLDFIVQQPTGQFIGFLAYRDGLIYSTAFNSHRIYRTDLEGNIEVFLGSAQGSVDGDASVARFSQPNGIAFSATGDTMYVSDFGTQRLRMVTNLDPVSPVYEINQQSVDLKVYPSLVSNDAQVKFQLTKAALAKIEVLDINGRVVQVIQQEMKLDKGRHQLNFNRYGLAVGAYFVRLEVEGSLAFVERIIVQD